jgi:uncharacterized membrane protein
MTRSKPIDNFLAADDLTAIETAVGAAERTTIGEIKVVVVAKSRKGLFRVFDPLRAVEMRALWEFKKMGVHRSRERTGVLIMVSVAERRIRIIADEGIHAKVEDGTWDRIVETISAQIREGEPRDGILRAVTAVGQTLAKHFPPRAGHRNQLSDDVTVEE